MRRDFYSQFLRKLPISCSGMGEVNPGATDVSWCTWHQRPTLLKFNITVLCKAKNGLLSSRSHFNISNIETLITLAILSHTSLLKVGRGFWSLSSVGEKWNRNAQVWYLAIQKLLRKLFDSKEEINLYTRKLDNYFSYSGSCFQKAFSFLWSLETDNAYVLYQPDYLTNLPITSFACKDLWSYLSNVCKHILN